MLRRLDDIANELDIGLYTLTKYIYMAAGIDLPSYPYLTINDSVYDKLIHYLSINGQQKAKRKEGHIVICSWENIYFGEKEIYIYVDVEIDGSIVSLIPLRVAHNMAQKSFNYVKNFLSRKLPFIKVRCDEKKVLKVESRIDLEKAILLIHKSNIHSLEDKNLLDKEENSPYLNTNPKFLEHKEVLQRLKLHKSEYLNYLASKQNREYKIVLLWEILSYIIDNKNHIIKEETFIFTFKVRNNPFIIYENVNPARSTVVFEVSKDRYIEALRSIIDYFSSNNINKREKILMQKINFQASGILNYYRLTHEAFKNWKKDLVIRNLILFSRNKEFN